MAPLVPDNYPEFLRTLKEQIRTAQVKAALAVNREMILLYWQIGQAILLQQQREGWGTKVIDQLSKDLRREFPDNSGFSPRNLKYMRSFAETWPDEAIVQEVLAQIPWYHNIALLEKLKAPEERLWYAQKTIEHGWSRNVLVHQIESHLFDRQGEALTNFAQTLPPAQSDLAQQLLKSPYSLEFLGLSEAAHERELEQALVSRMRDFLLELGVGFSFMGSQFRLEVGGEEFFIDMLFYHVRLRCYVVIELKTTEFRPEYSGQINFYVNAIDNTLRHPDDNPTIGMVLCKSKNQTVVEYALQGMSKPIGVSTYRLGDPLPEQLQKSLPSVEQLQMELESVVADSREEQTEEL